MGKTLVLVASVFLTCCSDGTPNARNPAIEAEYHRDIKCAVASLDATLANIESHRDTSTMENAAVQFGNKAADAGESLGKSRDEVLSEIKSEGHSADDASARKAIAESVPVAEQCLSELR